MIAENWMNLHDPAVSKMSHGAVSRSYEYVPPGARIRFSKDQVDEFGALVVIKVVSR
jgi:hypothetical protein